MGLVFLKELKELLRDRRTLFFMIALPLLMLPVILGLTMFVSSKAVKEAQTESLKFVVVGEQYAYGLITQLEQADGLELVELAPGDDFVTMIKNETIDFAVEVPDNFASNELPKVQSTIKLHLNDASVNFVFDRVNKVVEGLSKARQDAVFESFGISAEQQLAMIEPVKLEKINIADERESIGEKVGGFVPYMLFLICIQSCMLPASDLGAGEKERGTLETLLISPIDRTSLVLGKFLVICFAGLVTALLTVGSMLIWATIASKGLALEVVAKIAGQIGFVDAALMFLMIIPVVAIFGSGLLSLSIFAKSIKEAQGYMGSVIFLVIVPLVLALLPGVTLDSGWAWVPLTNVALAMKELFKGTMDYYALFSIFASTSAVAVAFIAFCVFWFKKERVLFR